MPFAARRNERHASDATRPHCRAQSPQPVDEVADETREAVDRHGDLDERIRTAFVESPVPGRYGRKRTASPT